MVGAGSSGEPTRLRQSQWMARTALTAIGVSVVLMVVIGALGPSAAVPRFPPAPPWPPWFIQAYISSALAAIVTWMAVLIGSTGLAVGLVAARRGWRPSLRRLIAGSVLAVVALMVIPPTGSADMLLYAAYGRIAALGHSPYTYFPEQLRSSGDPVGTVTGLGYLDEPSRYGPAAIVTEEVASRLAGDSAARTIFWLKAWNGLAYLALVLALDRLLREDEIRRIRAHLLWSLNPLMLWAVMAGGHVDGLAIGVGAVALFAMRRVDSRRALLAGVLLGLASAIKAPFALFGVGLAWAARRSRLALAALGIGAAVVTIPCYLLAGRTSIVAGLGVAKLAPVDYVPWFAVGRVLHWHDPTTKINALGLIGFVLLGLILVRRMPSGPSDFPAVRVALAMVLAWLIVSPQQRPWYDAMIFPLLALMPATRLDWIVLIRAAAGALAELPPLVRRSELHPAWLSETGRIASVGIVPLTLTAVGIILLWLCFTNDWRAVANPDSNLVDAMPLSLPSNPKLWPVWSASCGLALAPRPGLQPGVQGRQRPCFRPAAAWLHGHQRGSRGPFPVHYRPHRSAGFAGCRDQRGQRAGQPPLHREAETAFRPGREGFEVRIAERRTDHRLARHAAPAVSVGQRGGEHVAADEGNAQLDQRCHRERIGIGRQHGLRVDRDLGGGHGRERGRVSTRSPSPPRLRARPSGWP
jgi:hypothetical protein